MMLKSLFSSRKMTLTVVVFLIAFVICGVAWLRFFAAVAANPSPVRYVEYITAAGTLAPFRQDCAGPSFIENDAVWRFCEYEDGAALANLATDGAGAESGVQWGMVRFDLAAGVAELLWPLPESADTQLLALGQSPAGDLAVAWGAPELTAIYVLRAGGGVEALGLPDNAPAALSGLAWTTAGIELIAASEDGATVYTHESGAWGAARALAHPAVCDDPAMICALQMSHRTADGWRSVYAVARRTGAGVSGAEVTILAALEAEAPETVDTVALADLDPAQYALDAAGDLVGLGALFDQSPGNVINWSLRAAPFVLHDGTWARVVAPQLDASFYFSAYTITESGDLEWIPGTRYPQRSWQIDQWVALRSSGGDIFLAEIGGDSGPTLAQDVTLAWQGRADTALLPASDGGYWVLGPYGAYLKASAGLERADGLSLAERVVRAFENFTDLDKVNSTFYREKRALKMAAFPLVLLSLPLGYVVVFAVRQARKDGQTWVWLLLQISVAYVLIATGFFLWFWKIMDQF